LGIDLTEVLGAAFDQVTDIDNEFRP